MFGLLSTLFKGINSGADGASTGQVAIDPIRAAEADESTAKRELATLIRQQRTEQTAMDFLRSRQSALEDRVVQAMAAGRDDLATNGARAIADLVNQASVRMQTLARLDERVSRLRHSVSKAHRRIIALRRGAAGDSAMGPEDGPERSPVSPLPDPSADTSPTDAPTENGFNAATTVRAEDILIRLRTTPAPTTQYLSP